MTNSAGEERPLTAHLAHCPEPRRRSLDRTDTGRSALVAGTGLHAPKRSLVSASDHSWRVNIPITHDFGMIRAAAVAPMLNLPELCAHH